MNEDLEAGVLCDVDRGNKSPQHWHVKCKFEYYIIMYLILSISVKGCKLSEVVHVVPK